MENRQRLAQILASGIDVSTSSEDSDYAEIESESDTGSDELEEEVEEEEEEKEEEEGLQDLTMVGSVVR
jgi:hypothetical protein